MFDINEVLRDYNLSPEEYEKMLQDCSDIVAHQTDKTWDDISKQYDIGWNGDSIRKACQPVLVGSSFVKQYYEQKKSDQSPSLFDSQRRELERLKIKYRDERNAWQKQNYTNARFEETMDLLGEKLSNFGAYYFDKEASPMPSYSNRTMIIMLSDLHIGLNFDSYFGKYNSDIAFKRLDKYLNKILEVGLSNAVQKVIVVSLGDQISGNIHKTIQIANKENVIDQIKIASELIASFCGSLCHSFKQVDFYSVPGNHSRLDKKEDAVHDERMDDLVAWIVSKVLGNIDNFAYHAEANIDSGILSFFVEDKKYVCVHGDFDVMNKQGIESLCSFIHEFPYAVLRGHMHYPAYQQISGINVVQSGSLSGAGDSYTIEKRLSGGPNQTILVCDHGLIDSIINVGFTTYD